MYSRSGNTKKIADQIKKCCEKHFHQVDVVDVIVDRQPGFLKAGYCAIRQNDVSIVNKEWDVSSMDVVFIGCPVWAGKPAPYINAMIRKTSGFERIKSAVFITCAGGEQPGSKAIDLLQSYVKEKNAMISSHSLIVHMSRKGEIKKEMPPVNDFVTQVLSSC